MMISNPKANNIDLDTGESDSILANGEQLLKEHRYKEALVICLKASEINPKNGKAWRARAKAEVMCLRYTEAIESCRKAVELDPKNAEIYFLKSFSHGVLGQFQEALDAIDLGLKIDPQNKLVWFTRGQYLYALGRLEEALTSFGTALKLSPDSEYLKEVTEKIKKWLTRDGKSTDEIEKVMAFLQQGANAQIASAYIEASKVNPRAVSKAFQKDYALTHLQNPEELLKNYERTKAMDQPQISLELSQKDFEFSHESWVEITLNNKGKTIARDITIVFSAEVNIKHMDITPEIVQQAKEKDNLERINLNVIPELKPGNQVKKFVKQTKVVIIWISVFKPGGLLPSINGHKMLWRLNATESVNIYIAQRNSDNLKMVIKIPIFKPEQTAQMQEFLNEVKQAAKLVHPHIVRIYQYGENPSPWLSMEYMTKGTLTRQIGRLTIAEAIEIALNLGGALAFARTARLSHRAINPENVLFDEKGTPKFANWRIGPIMQKLGKNQSPIEIATTYYPPEKLIPGMGGIDWLTDIYQFGVMLFEMLTGRAPFPGKGDELIASIKASQPLKPSDLNPDVIDELDTLVLRCMAKNKKDRYQEPLYITKDLEKISRLYLSKGRTIEKRN